MYQFRCCRADCARRGHVRERSERSADACRVSNQCGLLLVLSASKMYHIAVSSNMIARVLLLNARSIREMETKGISIYFLPIPLTTQDDWVTIGIRGISQRNHSIRPLNQLNNPFVPSLSHTLLGGTRKLHQKACQQ